MDTSAFTTFDIIVLATILLSTLFAFSRGFVTTALSFLAWGGAFFTAVLGFDMVAPWVQSYITQEDVANIATFALLFFISLFIFKQIAVMIGGKVKSSVFGFLDRSLGALFGLLRGYVLVCIAFIAISAFFGSPKPTWFVEAQTYDFVKYGAEMVTDLTKDMLGDEDDSAAQKMIQQAKDSAPSQYIQETASETLEAIVDKASQDKLDEIAAKVADAEKDE